MNLATPEPVIHIDGDTLTAVLDQRGWRKGSYGTDGPVCLYGAVRLCAPVAGDAYLIEQVKQRQGHGTSWNDDASTTEADVRAWIAPGIDVTDAELADTYGPQWQAVVALVRTLAAMTPQQVNELAAARAAARDAARDAAWDAAWAAARAAVTWDLASADGAYTFAQRDRLLAPFRAVFGDLPGLIDEVPS
jgi:hypothetical protein